MAADTLPGWTFMLAVIVAAVLEVAANLMLGKSDGFKRRLYAVGALILVCLAFSCLAYAIRGMDLAVAYTTWGAFGILGTSLGGWVLFRQGIRPCAWLGIAMLISGMTMLHLG